jgi:hypothetical protein
MRLDIRLPIGMMFSIIGALLVAFGIFGDKSIYKNSLGINVNLGWGLVMLVFGVVMFILGRRGTATARLAEDSPEGKKIDGINHEAGSEK